MKKRLMKKRIMSRRSAEPTDRDKQMRREVSLAVRAADGDTPAAVTASVSSELPYYRDWLWLPDEERWAAGYEVLGHKPGEIDFSRMKDGLIVQDGHRGDQIGLIRSPEVKDGKLGGEIEWCCGARAQEIKRDAEAGIRRNMSIGYKVEKYERDGEKDGKPIYRAVRWMPYECSFVNVPADAGVGVGRSTYQDKPAAKPAVDNTKGIQIMDHPETKAGITADQVVECFRLAKSANMAHAEVTELLDSGKPFDEVRSVLEDRLEKHIEEMKSAKPKTPAGGGGVKPILDADAEREVKKRYSLHNVIRALAGDTSVDVGFEREMSDEIAGKRGRQAQGIIVPDCVRAAANASDGALTTGRPAYNADTTAGGITGIGGAGNNLIGTSLLAGSLIEALHDALVLRSELGAQVLTGLVGDIAIPKGGKVTAAWITTEGGDATKTNPTFGQIKATPHSCGAYVDITRQLLLQSSIDVQAFTTRELVYALAYALERAAYQGTGSSGQPKGLTALTVANDGIAAVNAWSNTPTYDKLVALVKATRAANTYRPSMRFVGDAGVWGALATTRDFQTIDDGASTPKVVAAVGGQNRLLDVNTDRVIGRQFVESHLVPSATLLYGDFSQLVLCLWSGTDLIVDQYSQCTKGALRVVALQDSDVIIRRPEAFAKATGVHA